MRRGLLFVLAGWIALMPVAASAQSLADIARQEEARRKSTKSVKRLTNADLMPDPRATAPIAAVAAAPMAAAVPAVASGNTSSGQPAVVAAPTTTAPAPESEVVWRARGDGLRKKIEKATADVAAMTGAQHADARMQARAEVLLKQAQATLARYQSDLRQFEAEAAAAKIPAAWIR